MTAQPVTFIAFADRHGRVADSREVSSATDCSFLVAAAFREAALLFLVFAAFRRAVLSFRVRDAFPLLSFDLFG